MKFREFSKIEIKLELTTTKLAQADFTISFADLINVQNFLAIFSKICDKWLSDVLKILRIAQNWYQIWIKRLKISLEWFHQVLSTPH